MENGNSPEGKQPLVSPRSILEILRICRPISSMLGSSEWLLFGPRVFALSGLLLLNDLPTLKNAWSRKLSGRNTEGVPEVKKTLPWKCKNPQMVPILPDLDKDFLFSGFWGLCEVIGFIKTCLCHTYLYNNNMSASEKKPDWFLSYNFHFVLQMTVLQTASYKKWVRNKK